MEDVYRVLPITKIVVEIASFGIQMVFKRSGILLYLVKRISRVNIWAFGMPENMSCGVMGISANVITENPGEKNLMVNHIEIREIGGNDPIT